MAKLIIKVDRNGMTDLTVLGIQGAACAPIVGKFQKALGGQVVADVATMEMFNQAIAAENHLLAGGGTTGESGSETGLS